MALGYLTSDYLSKKQLSGCQVYVTCIRDYIHVLDLFQTHLLALDRLLSGKEGGSYNLENGSGFSVRQVIEVAQRVTGRNIVVHEKSRRIGDPAQLVADYSLARQEMGWIPEITDLEKIIEDAWRWHGKSRCCLDPNEA
ncbi:MAG: hypothetical protein ACOCUV_01320 [bacterium]